MPSRLRSARMLPGGAWVSSPILRSEKPSSLASRRVVSSNGGAFCCSSRCIADDGLDGVEEPGVDAA